MTVRKVNLRRQADEFAILASDSTEANAEIFSTRLQERIDAHNQRDNRRYRLSLSAGYACYDPENPCCLDELIMYADTSMYQQKKKRKDLLPQGVSLSNNNPYPTLPDVSKDKVGEMGNPFKLLAFTIVNAKSYSTALSSS